MEVVNVGDETDECNRNSEEDDHDRNESGGSSPSHEMLSGLDAQISPHDFLGDNTELLGRELGVGLGLPVLHHLPGVLGVALGVEFEENAANKLTLAVPVLVLLCLNLGEKLSKMRATVLDGVDLLADEELELVGWALLGVNPLGPVVDVAGDIVLLALLSLEPVLVRIRLQLYLAILELESGLVAVLDELLQILGVGGDPGVLDTGEHLEEGRLRERLGDVGKEDGAGRQTAGAPWRATVSLAQVDDVEGLARNNDHDQAEEDERDTGVCIVAVDVHGRLLGNVAHGEDVKLLVPSAPSGIDGEENRPCDDASQQRDGDEDLEVAHEEIAIDGLVVKNERVGEIFEIFYPPKQPPTGSWRLALLAEMVEVGSRGIYATEILSRNDESRHKC